MNARGLAAFLATAMVAMAGSQAPAMAADGLEINVLSTRPDLVTGGQALVSIARPATVRLNGSDVTGQFATRPDGRFEGLLTGLANGADTVTASAPGVRSTSLRIVNHPNGGPLFSGPQLQPWPCPAGALDAQCNRPTAYAFQYMSTSGGGFQPYHPSNPPADLATTPTQSGRTGPLALPAQTGPAPRA